LAEFSAFVTLVAGDDYDSSHAFGLADGVEQIDGAHDIGRVGFDWPGIRWQHQCLCCEMEDDFRLVVVEGGS
jgi:hypothetical protein